MKYLKAATLLFLSAACLNAASYEDSIEREFIVDDSGILTISTDRGHISVEGADVDVVSVAIYRKLKDADEEEALAAFEEIDIEFHQDGNSIELDIETPDNDSWSFLGFGKKRPQLHIKAMVPTQFDIELKTSGGHLNLSGTEGASELKTSGGHIKLRDLQGPIDAKTSGGHINVKDCSGTVEVKTSGGHIKIDSVSGHVEAKTSGGHIDVIVDEGLDADSELKTSGGHINARLTPGIKASIDAKTSGGRVSTEFPIEVVGEIKSNSLKGDINGGGPKLELKTSGGNIRITKL